MEIQQQTIEIQQRTDGLEAFRLHAIEHHARPSKPPPLVAVDRSGHLKTVKLVPLVESRTRMNESIEKLKIERDRPRPNPNKPIFSTPIRGLGGEKISPAPSLLSERVKGQKYMYKGVVRHWGKKQIDESISWHPISYTGTGTGSARSGKLQMSKQLLAQPPPLIGHKNLGRGLQRHPGQGLVGVYSALRNTFRASYNSHHIGQAPTAKEAAALYDDYVYNTPGLDPRRHLLNFERRHMVDAVFANRHRMQQQIISTINQKINILAAEVEGDDIILLPACRRAATAIESVAEDVSRLERSCRRQWYHIYGRVPEETVFEMRVKIHSIRTALNVKIAI